MISKGCLTTKDNQKIAYSHYKNGNDKLVIIVHGFYNSKDSVLLKDLAEKLVKKYDVFMFDFRGHGESSGVFTWTSKEQEDLSTALKYLDGKYHKTAIAAFSFGGSISINVLSESKIPVHSFICISAPSDASKVDYKLWKLDIENDIYYTLLTKDGRKGKGFRMGPFWLPKQKPIDSIGKINIPTLFIHGDKDWVIDMWHSKALYEKAVSLKKLIIIKDGPHAEYLIRKHTPIFFKEINTWLQETM